MRATLRASASQSVELGLAGSDGALTVTPRCAVLAFAVLAWPGAALLSQMDFTHDGGKTHHGL
jgi:hypothetical protein